MASIIYARQKKLNRLRRMQEVAVIRLQMKTEELRETRIKVEREYEKIRDQDLPPDELKRKVDSLTRKLDRAEQNLKETLDRAVEWRDELIEELRVLGRPPKIGIPIMTNHFVMYIIWEWYTGNEYSGQIPIRTEQAVELEDFEWTGDAEDDIQSQIDDLAPKEGMSLIEQIVKEDNKARGTLSSSGISSWEIRDTPLSKKESFARIDEIVITNDELARKNGFKRSAGGREYIKSSR